MLLKNINYYDSDIKDFKKANILIEKDRFKKITEEDIDSSDFIDMENKYMLPSYVNTHTHISMSLFRNYADDMELMDWLNNKIWPLEAKLTKSDIYNGAKLSLIEMVKSGTTTVNDMYFMMHEVMKASHEVGTRGVFGNGLIDVNSNFDKEFEKTIDLYENNHLENQISGVSPHAIYTLSKEGLIKSKEYANKNKQIYHIHAAESLAEMEFSKENFNLSPIEYLDSLNVLDEKTVLAHCVHLSDNDMKIIKKRNSHIAINLSSNLKLASGIPDIKGMIDNDLNITIGTDGPASNNKQSILYEMQLISKVIKGVNKIPTILKPHKLIEMATVNGAKALGFSELGEIREGFIADFIIYDLEKVHNEPLNNPLNALIYSAKDEDLVMTVSNGKVLYENGNFKTCDIDEAILNARNAINGLIRR